MALPDDAILLHIGPHKTGTTSVQVALHGQRGALEAQGATYPGRGMKADDAIRAVLGVHPTSGRVPPISVWHGLVDEAKAAPGRVVISNEFLSEASPDVIRTIASDLGPGRIHVVVTLRSIDRILPSQWQQFVQGGVTKPFDAWLAETLRASGATPNCFWLRHRHDRLVARWAEAVGKDRVSVVVVDEQDPGQVLQVFEDLLGLRSGTLSAEPDPRNRSMTWAEVEAVRALNVACQAEHLDRGLYVHLIQRGVSEYMKRRTPDREELRVSLPADAAAEVAAIAGEIADGIASTGVRVIGDLARLRPSRPERGAGGATQAAPTCLDPEVSAWLSMGVLDALAVGSAQRDLAGIPATRIAAAIARRPVAVARDWFRLVARRVRGDVGA